MTEINTALEKLLETHINISQAARSQGSTSHNYIRDVLKGKNDTNSLFPRLVDGDFLSGSYARGTKLKPLDDIDVMVVIDGSGLYVVMGVSCKILKCVDRVYKTTRCYNTWVPTHCLVPKQ